MVTTLYLIRHCEALGNINDTFQGSIDEDITEKGAKQLEKLAERCRKLTFDVIYSSPLIRAYKTAEAANKYHGLPIIKDKDFEEINGGELIEDFVQGSQSMRRESPALRSYNTTIKSFTALSKSLLDLLPEKAQKQAGNELMGFITQPKAAGKP